MEVVGKKARELSKREKAENSSEDQLLERKEGLLPFAKDLGTFHLGHVLESGFN